MEPRRVLLVDDHPDMRDLERAVLRSAGCTIVAEAARGDEAAERVGESAVDVIVLDWEMPGGTGIDVLPQLRRLAPDARIILFSSRDAADARPRAIAAGADLYLEKSRTGALVAAVRGLAGAPLPVPATTASRDALVEKWQQRCVRARLDPDEPFATAVLDAICTDSLPASADELTAVANPDQRVEDTVRRTMLLRSVLAENLDADLAPPVLADISVRLDRAFDELIHSLVAREASRLRAEASTDALTELGNRRSFDIALEAEVDRAARYGHPLTIVIVDLDGLKTLNDQNGHDAGDLALRNMADALRSCTRSVDTAYRIGGDEFVVLLPETAGGRVPDIINRLTAAGAPAHSWGAASYGHDTDDRSELLAIADRRLRDARQSRR